MVAVGVHPLNVKSAPDDSIFQIEEEEAQEGFGEMHPRCLGAPGGGAREGVRTASPYRPVGRQGLTGCAPGWGGANIWEPPGGRTGRGAHGKPLSSRRATGAYRVRPWVGRGKNCSRQGYCAPELRGRRGLTSSICVISACANIHRISPQSCPAVDHGAKGYLFIVVQARQEPQR